MPWNCYYSIRKFAFLNILLVLISLVRFKVSTWNFNPQISLTFFPGTRIFGGSHVVYSDWFPVFEISNLIGWFGAAGLHAETWLDKTGYGYRITCGVLIRALCKLSRLSFGLKHVLWLVGGFETRVVIGGWICNTCCDWWVDLQHLLWLVGGFEARVVIGGWLKSRCVC